MSWFIAQPQIMFCSDGELHGVHPRGAGSFPRVLGQYVREKKTLLLALAIHKMTGLPAHQLRLKGRERIAPRFTADLVPSILRRSLMAPPLAIPRLRRWAYRASWWPESGWSRRARSRVDIPAGC